MDKVEILEDLKRKINNRVESGEIAPIEVDKIIKQCFDKVEQIFEEYNCSSSSISDYIYESYRDTKSGSEKVFEERKENILESVNQKIHRMTDEVIEKNVIEENTHRYSFENMDTEIDNSRDTTKIVDRLVDNLNGIRSHATRVLASRDYSDARIEQIMDDVNSFIHKVEDRQGQEIFEILRADGTETVKEIIEQYESVEKELTTLENEQVKEEQLSNRNAFVNSISVKDKEGMSFEEQSENAKAFINRVEQEKEKIEEKPQEFLRGDILE